MKTKTNRNPKIVTHTEYGITIYNIEYTDNSGDRVLSTKQTENYADAKKLLAKNRYYDND